MVQVNSEKVDNVYNLQKKEQENVQKMEKTVNANQKILASNNEKLSILEQNMQLMKTQEEKLEQKVMEVSNLLKYNQEYIEYVDGQLSKLIQENRMILDNFKNINEEQVNELLKKLYGIREVININKENVGAQFKSLENFMQQNKMISSAICGKIEKFEEIIKAQDRKLTNMDNYMMTLMNEVSIIQEKLNDSEK
jgi:small-conductance mechanosensitive channel